MTPIRYETRCDIHGRPDGNDKANLKRVGVGVPYTKKIRQSGCPICRRENEKPKKD